VEWEFEAATRAGLTRLVFLVDDDAVGLPRAAMFDGEFDVRQQAFRRRLRDCGVTVQTVRSPEELELAVFAALRPPGGSGVTGSGGGCSAEHGATGDGSRTCVHHVGPLHAQDG